MAYIIPAGPPAVGKSAATAEVSTAPRSKLARGDFSQQVDVFRLARRERGARRMRTLWNQFSEECPGLARLVISYVRKEDEADARAQGELDGMITKAAGGPAEPAWVAEAANSPDPALRELAWRHRNGNG